MANNQQQMEQQVRAILAANGVDPSTLTPQGIQQIRTLIASGQLSLNGVADPQTQQAAAFDLQAQTQAFAQQQAQAQAQAQRQAQAQQTQAQAQDPRIQALYQQFQQLVVQQKDQLGELTKERLEALWQAFLERGLQQQAQAQAAQAATQPAAQTMQDQGQEGERKIMSVIGMPQVEETQLVRLLFDLLGKPEGIEIIHLTLLHDSVWFVVFCNEAYAEAASKQLTSLFRARNLECDALTLTPSQLPPAVIQQLTVQAQQISEARHQPAAQEGAQPVVTELPTRPAGESLAALSDEKTASQSLTDCVEMLKQDLNSQAAPEGMVRVPGFGFRAKTDEEKVWKETERGKYKKDIIEKVGLTLGLLPTVQVPGVEGITKMWPAGRGKPVTKLMGALGMRVAPSPEAEAVA